MNHKLMEDNKRVDAALAKERIRETEKHEEREAEREERHHEK